MFNEKTKHALLGYIETDYANRENSLYDLEKAFGMS